MVLDILRLILGLFFLSLGSLQDIRTRTAKNQLWQAMGGLGLLLLTIEMAMDGREPHYYLFLPLLFLLYLFPFIEYETEGKMDLKKLEIPKSMFGAAMALALSLAVLAGVELGMKGLYAELAATALFLVIVYGLYYTGLLFGGGDTKAMMAITLMFPFYPDVAGLPLLQPTGIHVPVVTFPITVLFTGLLLMLFLPLVFLGNNLKKKETSFPMMLFAYRCPLDQVQKKQLFLMEKVRDGKVKQFHFPPRSVSLTRLKVTFLEMLGVALDPEGEETGKNKTKEKIKTILHLEKLDEGFLVSLKEDFDELDPENELTVIRLEKYFEKTELSELRELLLEHDIRLLKEAGRTQVWVSPKIPFLVPLTVSYVLSFFVGSLLFYLVEGISTLF